MLKRSDASGGWWYDARRRCWVLEGAAWEGHVERWPASLEYSAQLINLRDRRHFVRAPHVFVSLADAQAWCESQMEVAEPQRAIALGLRAS